MSPEAFVALDLTGRILWANRAAHQLIGAAAGTLVGRNYLEFCPPETHADLLRLQARKLRGETVKFLLRLAGGTVEVTSGPVQAEGRTYLFVVARRPAGRPRVDAEVVGRAAVAHALGGRSGRLDLGQCLMGALRAEAARLRGRVRLGLPPELPKIHGRPGPVRLILRCLLLAFAKGSGRVEVRLGQGRGRVWVEFAGPSRSRRLPERALAACRSLLWTDRALLRKVRGRGIRLSFPRA